jgi:DNA mismatch repair protein MutL
MNRIQVLPEILANKIAAGEIVERPASVVKELLENSLDARSRNIFVSVSSGGKRSILIRDDGEGMSQDDALLAFEHHATSKLRSAEDLSSIATLGFRGEALPSIASVSRLTLKTRADDAASISGTEIDINGGVINSVKSIPWDKGTEIEVRGLFFNVPARKKFLRSTDTEIGHIARLVTHYALAHPEIRFTLESEGRTLLDTVAVTDLKERIYQIFGDNLLDSLIEFHGHSGSVKVHGFGSRPQQQRTNSYWQYIYVNRRMVRDKVLMGAIRQAYRSYIPASAYPIVILFLELPFDEVDVNAHPAKTEIRFQDQSTIHRLTFETIDRALKERVSIPDFVHRQTFASSLNQIEQVPLSDYAAAMAFEQRDALQPVQSAATPNPSQQALNYPFQEIRSSFAPQILDHHSMNLMPDMLYGSPRETRNAFQVQGVRILGQLHDSYIIACDAEGLLIVDQHVAHERILYESFAAAMQTKKVEIQGLLIPITWELPPHQMALLNRITPELMENGFHIEPFGGSSVIIRSMPAIAKDSDCQSLISEILEGLETEERSLDVQIIRDKIAIKTACKAAVKVNMPLSIEKMQWLLDQLAQTQIPTNCPHGRPIILRFSMYEIQRNFGRI